MFTIMNGISFVLLRVIPFFIFVAFAYSFLGIGDFFDDSGIPKECKLPGLIIQKAQLSTADTCSVDVREPSWKRKLSVPGSTWCYLIKYPDVDGFIDSSNPSICSVRYSTAYAKPLQ